MASLPLVFGSPVSGRVVCAATAAKGASGSSEEKSFFDWVLGNLQKQDQFYETDPVLKKVEEKGGNAKSSGGKNGTVSVPSKKKNGGFGGLFAKK